MSNASNALAAKMHGFLTKKFPDAFEITVSQMQDGPFGRVEANDEVLCYSFNKADRPYVTFRRTLNPTEKSVRLEPHDHAIQITGEGDYKDHYILRHVGEGFFDTTTDVNKVRLHRKYDADNLRNQFAQNAQHRYGGGFVSVKVK